MDNVRYFSDYELENNHDYELRGQYCVIDGEDYKIVRADAQGIYVVRK